MFVHFGAVPEPRKTFILSEPSDVVIRNSPKGMVDFNFGPQKDHDGRILLQTNSRRS